MPRLLGHLTGGLALLWSTIVLAQEPAAIRCPEPGTRLRFSTSEDGIEAVRDLGGGVCRYRNLKTLREFNRFLIFDMSSKFYEDNIEQLRSLSPLQVGKSVSIAHSGPANLGGDGAWDITFSVEKFETIQVPIGSLPAYVILKDERGFGGGGRWLRRLWYSPVVGYAVQYEFVTLRGNPPKPYPRNWQLVEVKLR